MKRGNILTPSGKLENVFSESQLGLVQQEILYTRMPRETVRHLGKKWRTHILFRTDSEGTGVTN